MRNFPFFLILEGPMIYLIGSNEKFPFLFDPRILEGPIIYLIGKEEEFRF